MISKGRLSEDESGHSCIRHGVAEPLHDDECRVRCRWPASARNQTREDDFRRQPVVTEVTAFEIFEAGECHQDYYCKNPVRYSFYVYRWGGDQRLEEPWSFPGEWATRVSWTSIHLKLNCHTQAEGEDERGWKRWKWER